MNKRKNSVYIPSLSLFSNKLTLNKEKNYIATNLFDYSYYSKKNIKVIYLPIKFETLIEFQKIYIEATPNYNTNININNQFYRIDLKRIYLNSLFAGYKEKILETYMSSMKIDYTVNYEIQLSNNITINHPIFGKIKKLLLYLFEFFNNRKILCEDHPSVLRRFKSNRIFKSKLTRLNQLIYNDLFEEGVMAFNINKNSQKKFKESLEEFLTVLQYLDHKKYENIYISGFTGMSQYAAIVYSKTKNKIIDIVQHGRYMVHHLPAPEMIEYLPNNIKMWEEEFISHARNNNIKKIKHISRNIILGTMKKTKYIIIAPSSPLFIDIDIYYYFWEKISKLLAKISIKICLKVHIKDIITTKILSFFKISDKIEIIPIIETLPIAVITVNSTFYYELRPYVPVFDYKETSSFNELFDFVNNQINKYID